MANEQGGLIRDGEGARLLPGSRLDIEAGAAFKQGGTELKFARGEAALDGSNPTPIATGLTTVVAFVAMLKGSTAPGDNTSVLTSVIDAAGVVNVYAWKNTSGTDPTLVASTGTETIYWIAIGT